MNDKSFKVGDKIKVCIAVRGEPVETTCIVVSINKKKMLEVATCNGEEVLSSRVFWAHPKQVEKLK